MKFFLISLGYILRQKLFHSIGVVATIFARKKFQIWVSFKSSGRWTGSVRSTHNLVGFLIHFQKFLKTFAFEIYYLLFHWNSINVILTFSGTWDSKKLELGDNRILYQYLHRILSLNYLIYCDDFPPFHLENKYTISHTN